MIIDGKIKVIDSISGLIKKHGEGVKLIVERGGDAEDIIKGKADNITEANDSEVVGLFEDKKMAREALISLFDGDHDVRVDEAGMEEVFLNISGAKIDEGGELV